MNYLKYYLSDYGGYQSTIVDCAYYDKEYNEVIEKLNKTDTPIVGITGYTLERFHAYRLIRKIRKEIPGASIIVGGRHFGFLATDTIENLPEVDIVVKGDGEIPFKNICDALIQGKSYHDLNGIVYRSDDNKIVVNPPSPRDKNISKYRNYDREDYLQRKQGENLCREK